MPDLPEERLLVSVIIPAYNGIQWIEPTLRSVMDQMYQPVEIIVVDDGSTDGTGEFIRSHFPTVTVLNRPNGGPAAARNEGARAAHGELLAFLDMDDIWAPTKLTDQIIAVQDVADWGLCVTRVIKFSPEDGVPSFDKSQRRPGIATITHMTLLNDRWSLWRRNNIMTCSTALVRRAVFEEIGGFDEDPGLLCVDDFDFYLRISFRWKVIMVKAALVGYRITPGSLSRNKLLLHANARNALAKWAPQYPDRVPALIQRRNWSMMRKLLRMGKEKEAYDIFIAPVYGRKRSDLSFHCRAWLCRIHGRFPRFK